MVPKVLLPPVTPFTCHVTPWFVVVETTAENCAVVSNRVVAGPVTVTVMGGCVPPPPPVLPPLEQPATAEIMARKTNERTKRCIRASTRGAVETWARFDEALEPVPQQGTCSNTLVVETALRNRSCAFVESFLKDNSSCRTAAVAGQARIRINPRAERSGVINRAPFPDTASAASRPLRTAPSIVEGHPVRVQSPARNRP